MFTPVVSTVVFAGVVLLYLRRTPANGFESHLGSLANILENQVTHARLLPKPSAHAFTYPTLAFLVSLDALESRSLDLARGWLFGYGGTSWRVTGLDSGAYLLPDNGRQRRGIKEKLRDVLEHFGHDGGRLGLVWMLTMPSYLGYEGINPLTVYYCYTADEGSTLAWVVLEIHNTFGEKHVHVLELGQDEDKSCPVGYDHQWTIKRDFHVSPFNDRLGHYTISVSAPPPPRSPLLTASAPRPKIRIHLHAVGESESTVGPLKLTATLVARRAVPLTTTSLLHVLALHPFALFLSFARILYHAWILHYVRQLDVFPRPDPKPAMQEWGDLSRGGDGLDDGSSHAEGVRRMYGGTGWQDEGVFEAYARRTVERVLKQRVTALGIAITLVSGDPSVRVLRFAPPASGPQASGEELTVYYTAPRFFSTLLVAPSAAHMLALGQTEDLFRVSSDSLFARVFVAPPATSTHLSLTQWLRIALLPQHFLSLGRSAEKTPARHPLDMEGASLNVVMICLIHVGDRLEKGIFTLARASFVPGMEPWGRWDRAAGALGRE